MLLDLLRHRLTKAAATLLQAQGPIELARVLAGYTDYPLFLEDHPWLQAAASHLPADCFPQISFISQHALPAPSLDITAVTVGLGAIPETGSVLLGSRTHQAFRLSLCPRRHIIIIPAHRAALTMAEALALTAAEPSGLVSWVTGPSRTADIEKILVLGAQGASELIVILYQEE
jgi:L-lactate dehydrogenase complex protein LldG